MMFLMVEAINWMIEEDLNLSDVPSVSEIAVVAVATVVAILSAVIRSIKPPIMMFILCTSICILCTSNRISVSRGIFTIENTRCWGVIWFCGLIDFSCGFYRVNLDGDSGY